jgi:hypothetical protein
VKPKPKAVNKPWHHFIVHGLDNPGAFTTVSKLSDSFNQDRRSKTMATAAATHVTQATPHRPTLFLAFELGG